MLFLLFKEFKIKIYYASFSYLTLFIVNLINSPVIIRTLSTSITYYTLSPYSDVVAYTYLSFHITNILFAHVFTKIIALNIRRGCFKHEVYFFNSIINNLIFHNLLAISLLKVILQLGIIGLPTNNDSSILLTELITWVKLVINGLYFLLIMSILLTLSLNLGAIRLTRIINTVTVLTIYSIIPSYNSCVLAIIILLFMEMRIIVTLIKAQLWLTR